MVTLSAASRLLCCGTLSLQVEPGHKKSLPKVTSSFKLKKLIGVHNPRLKSLAEVNLLLCNHT